MRHREASDLANPDNMNHPVSYTINVKGRLMDLSQPQVMGILNVTPDSFYSGSRMQTDNQIAQRARQIVEEGGTIIDLGAYSSRSGAADVSVAEETERLRRALAIIRDLYPEVAVSVDTFRAEVASRCIEDFGADIINDISGGQLDEEMFPTVARLNVPYILMHMRGTPQTMQQHTDYEDVTAEVLRYFGEKVDRLHGMGVKDIILDPGYGFAKTLEQNYRLLSQQYVLEVLGLPILAGVSRKTMIYKLLGTSPEEALNGTSVLNTIALQNGANILRVHDVREAVECIRIVQCLTKQA